MFETLFGTEIPIPLRLFIGAFIVAVITIVVLLLARWAFRGPVDAKQVRGPFEKYVGLRFISYLLRSVGALAVTLGFISLIVTLTYPCGEGRLAAVSASGKS